MLIKVLVDDTFPIPVRPQMAAWVVQDQLPLNHPQNIQSLMQALRKPPNTAFSFDGVFVTIGGNVLDVTLSALDQNLIPNAQLSINRHPPASPRRPRAESQSGNTPKTSPRGNADGNESIISPRGGNESIATHTEDDEYYVSSECGWFPFNVVQGSNGGSRVTIIDPLREPSADDKEPNSVELCDNCACSVAATPSLLTAVDRGYKPVLNETQIISGWVEKLGGGRIPRWQRRWMKVSEQSVDWYEEEPKQGTKPKIRNTRPVAEHGEFAIAEVMSNVDVAKYPKASDTKYQYFGITFRNPEQTMILRVSSAADKARFITFFNRLLKRWQQHGASRDPVFWKQWADSLLVATSDVGDVCLEKETARDEELRETAALEAAILKAQHEKPTLQAAVNERLAKVEVLKQQLRALDELRARHIKAAEAAELKVTQEQVKLEELVQECSEEVRHHKFLEQRAEEERQRAKADIKSLEGDIDVAALAKRHAFAKWRHNEEHHVDKHGPERKNKLYSFSLNL